MNFTIKPIAFVSNARTEIKDDHWGSVVSEIELAQDVPEASLKNISMFNQLDIIYLFDQVKDQDIVYSGHPRGNPDFPEMGIFAQRKKDRPNRIGLCRVELIQHSGRKLLVKHLDAIAGTPVLDIKPVFNEFELNSPIKQPAWVELLMKNYWI